MKEINEILYKYTTDMIGVEQHFLEVLDHQSRDNRLRDYREANLLIGRIRETLKIQIHLLEQYIHGLGVEGAEFSLKKAATKVTGMAAGLFGRIRQEDSVMRNFRDNYTALSMTVISYTMLHSTALALHEGELAALTLKNMKELVPLLIETSKAIPSLVIQELSVEGKAIDALVIQQAIDNTQQIWHSGF